jgi:hypothetical protein
VLTLLACTGGAWLAMHPAEPVARARTSQRAAAAPSALPVHEPGTSDERGDKVSDALLDLATGSSAASATQQPEPTEENMALLPLEELMLGTPSPTDPHAVLDGEPLAVERPDGPFATFYQSWREEPEDPPASERLRETLDAQIGDLGLSPQSLRVSCAQSVCRIAGMLRTLDELRELEHLPYAQDNPQLAFAQPQVVDGGVMLVAYDRLQRLR